MTPSRKRPLEGHVPHNAKRLPAGAVLFAVDWLLSMEDARTKMLGSGGTQGLASAAVGGDSRGNELAPYSDGDDGDEWDFDDEPIDSHIDVWDSLRRNFDAICEL